MHCISTAFQYPRLYLSETWARWFWLVDADTRSTNSIGMLRCAPSTTSQPQHRADGHAHLVIGDPSGDIQTQQQKQCADWSSDTPGSPPSVGAEYSYTVDLQTSTLQSHYRWTIQLAMAPARSPYWLTFMVMHGIACTGISRTCFSCRQPAWSTGSSLCWH